MDFKKMKKVLIFLTFLISAITILTSLTFLIDFFVSGEITNTNIIVVIALMFDVFVIIILNYIIYAKNYKNSPLKQFDKTEEKIIIKFIWAISIIVLLTIIFTTLRI